MDVQRSRLKSGWNVIATAGQTTCARGTPYKFYYRPGTDERKLLIYFQGGGACWDEVTCQGTFDAMVSDTEPDGYSGIFDYDNPENPVASYHTVFIPYCTGDVHVGDAEVVYDTPSGGKNIIRHRGFVNASTVLSWVYDNSRSPADILIIGSSAGSYGAIFFAPRVMQHYPNAHIIELGDSGVILLDHSSEILARWGMFKNLPRHIPGLARATPGNFSVNQLYTGAANTFPRNIFAQCTTSDDVVQSGFYALSGDGDWKAEAHNQLIALERGAKNFRYYVAGGGEHGLLPQQFFYSYRVGGVRLRDWFADLLRGSSVRSVRCMDCAVAEVYTRE